MTKNQKPYNDWKNKSAYIGVVFASGLVLLVLTYAIVDSFIDLDNDLYFGILMLIMSLGIIALLRFAYVVSTNKIGTDQDPDYNTSKYNREKY